MILTEVANESPIICVLGPLGILIETKLLVSPSLLPIMLLAYITPFLTLFKQIEAVNKTWGSFPKPLTLNPKHVPEEPPELNGDYEVVDCGGP